MKTILMKSDAIVDDIKKDIKKRIKESNKNFTLSIILVGDDPASDLYVKIKTKVAKELGINVDLKKFSHDTKEVAILKEISKLNKKESVNGILVQLPLPNHINTYNVINSLDVKKDIDRVHPLSVGQTMWNMSESNACTADGIIRLIDYYGIELESRNALVIGDSMIVGKPIFALLNERGATVTLANKRTKDLRSYSKEADIIISATGVKHLIGRKDIKKGSVLIDVGVTRENGKTYGDIDYNSVLGKASHVTPPTKSIGPLTVISLLLNIVV